MNPTNEIEQKIITDIEKIASFWDAIHSKRKGLGFFSRPLSAEDKKGIIKQTIADKNIGKFIEKADINDMIALIKIDSNVLKHHEVRAKIEKLSPSEHDQIMESLKLMNNNIFPDTHNKL